MKATAICYKLNTPIVYNKGTQWETTHDTFLEGYVYGITIEEVQAECDKANRKEINKLYNFEVKTDRVYFATEQEEIH